MSTRVSKLTIGLALAFSCVLASNVEEAKAQWGYGSYRVGGYYYPAGFGWGAACGPVFAPAPYWGPRPYYGGYGYSYVRGYCAPPVRSFGFSFGYSGGYRGGYCGPRYGYYRGGGWGRRGCW